MTFTGSLYLSLVKKENSLKLNQWTQFTCLQDLDDIAAEKKIERVFNSAWIHVARENNTLLTPAMVEEIVDPMSVSMARTHFSETIEKEMRKHGFTSKADFCRDVRQW